MKQEIGEMPQMEYLSADSGAGSSDDDKEVVSEVVRSLGRSRPTSRPSSATLEQTTVRCSPEPSPRLVEKIGVHNLENVPPKIGNGDRPEECSEASIHHSPGGAADNNNAHVIPWGMHVASTHDGKDILRHRIQKVMVDGVADQLHLEENDELLIVNGDCVVDIDHRTVLDAHLGQISKTERVQLILRRKPSGSMDYVYIEIESKIKITIDQGDGTVTIVKTSEVHYHASSTTKWGDYNIIPSRSQPIVKHLAIGSRNAERNVCVEDDRIVIKEFKKKEAAKCKFDVLRFIARKGTAPPIFLAAFRRSGVRPYTYLTVDSDDGVVLKPGEGKFATEEHPDTPPDMAASFRQTRVGRPYHYESTVNDGLYLCGDDKNQSLHMRKLSNVDMEDDANIILIDPEDGAQVVKVRGVFSARRRPNQSFGERLRGLVVCFGFGIKDR